VKLGERIKVTVELSTDDIDTIVGSIRGIAFEYGSDVLPTERMLISRLNEAFDAAARTHKDAS